MSHRMSIPILTGKHKGSIRSVAQAIALSMALAGCYRVPNSIRLYAADLPHRADGQYALIDDDGVKKSLVVKDALLQCSIDEEDKPGETSAACLCAKSSSADWTLDCKAWLGSHTPQRSSETGSPPVPAPAPTSSPAAPTPPG